ncbi:uncharacterized protein LOC115138596 isoform X3 [Oncorhynchus nerka]|uniref:uncharacterized protein LOC115138596 isoform X3 n=1 Tax=Oncorhynchus nerka TaxID=8023 RepID=UPI0031B8AD54
MLAAASKRRMTETHKMIAFALLFIATLLHGGVVAEYEVVTGPTRPVNDAGVIRGDDIATTQLSDEEADTPFVQIIVFPSIPGLDLSDILDDTTVAPVTKVVEETTDMREATGKAGEAATTDDDQETQAPQQILTSQSSDMVLIPEAGVMCVDKEAVQDRDAVSLKLKASSSCIDFEEAVPRWGKNSKLVLVSLLLTGLLLAILLIAGYYLKTHRPPPKGARLAEEGFQVDEENQANTLVSVAPLQPQEPLDKPPTNGHSATQTPVADTEM